jgi:hypothetical protein
VRAEPNLAPFAEDRAREREQRALEVAERDVGVDREPLDLVELGMYSGGGCCSIARICTGEVCTRRSRACGSKISGVGSM